MKCPLCAQPVADNAPYCPFCGKVFDEARTEQERVTMATGDAPPALDPVTVANREGEKALLLALLGTFLFGPLLVWAFIVARRSAAELARFNEPPNRLGQIAFWISVVGMAGYAFAISLIAALFLGAR